MELPRKPTSIAFLDGGTFQCRECGAVLRRSTREAGRRGKMECPREGCADLLESFRLPTYLKTSGRDSRSPFAEPLLRPPWLWIFWQTVSHVHRHVNVHAVSVASILITIVLAIAAGFGEESSHAREWLALAAGSIVVCVPAVAWLSLRAISPSDYARLALEGRRVDRQFRWVAWYMCHLCRKFTRRRAVATLDRLNRRLLAEVQRQIQERDEASYGRRTEQALERIESLYKKDLQRARRHVRRLEKILVASHVQVERATRMKEILADDWRIDRRRLCDHVFRFSPVLFEARAWKVVVNWQTLQDDGLLKRHIPLDRALDLLRENDRILRRLHRRASYLCLLSGSGFLFKWVAVFASRSSVRTSLIAYASAVAEVAARMDPRAEHRHPERGRRWLGLAHEPLARNRARLVALHQMQRAHPGVDLHRTLVTLCARGEEWCRAQIALRKADLLAGASEPLEGADEKVLKSIRNFETRRDLWERRREALSELLEDAGAMEQSDRESRFDRRETLQRTIKALRGLPESVVTAIHASQWEINNHFSAVFERERDRSKPALVVLLGYSHVLRDVVKTVLWKALDPTDRVFVVRLAEADFGSRLMDFELREDREWYEPGESPEFGVGDGGLLESLYKHEKDWHVYVLLDGDCFDRTGRVVQGADKREKLRQLETWTEGRRTTFLVAEGYKIYGDLTRIPDFFRDDLESISLIDGESPGWIVVGDSFVKDLSPPAKAPAANLGALPA